MKVFVTGATGVIGRRIIPLLVAGGHEVTAVGRTPEQRIGLASTGAKSVGASLFAPSELRAAVAGHDAVVNLATHMPASSFRMFVPGAWRENDRIRREGSANLVDAALATGVRRFVQESFAPVYQDRGSDWIDETVPIEPVDYNRSIADAEASALRFAASGGEGVVLRFGAFYGPDARLAEDLLRAVRRGLAPLPGPATSFISSVSHDDAATAVLAALNVPAGIYNVVDDEPVTHRAYFDALAAALGVPSPKLLPPFVTPLFGSAGSLLSRSLRISNKKLRETSGWAPKYRSVREGFKAVLGESGTPDAHPFVHAPRAG
jgi:nucleoside-diphosphate-sugar epimerase